MRNHQRALIFLLFCLVAAFFVNREDQRGGINGLNTLYEDWLRATSGEDLNPPSVTLLRIDESETGFWSWPPNPLDYAQLLHRLKSYNPKVIAIEAPLHWQGADKGLLDALRTACLQYSEGQILLSSILQFNTASPGPEEATLSLLWPLASISGNIDEIPAFTSILSLPNQRLTSLGFPSGFTSIDLGETTGIGTGLSVALLARINKTVVPSFVLLATMLELGVTADEVEVHLGKMIKVGNKATIPIDASGSLAISTTTRARPKIQNASILAHNPEELPGNGTGGLNQQESDALSNRVILLGVDNKGSRNITTGEETISQAELFALAIATIQSNSYFGPVPEYAAWISWAIIMVAGVTILRQRRRRAIGLSLLLVLLYFTGGMILFQSTQRWISPAVPLTLIACTFLSALLLTTAGKVVAEKLNNTGEPGDEKDSN